ncbi:MraY family glycosyltransferase [Ascidiimonas sp. W6]|uniref:MraY family glycosyltransferase n=1 Tax=Ascidiimonas meishanensis TaxID=3128903 RepID=UPI0030EBFA3D
MEFLKYAIPLYIGSFFLTFYTIPKIIKVVEFKSLMDDPNKRSSHTKKTPTLGGISFFYTLIFSLFFIREWDIHDEAIFFVPGLTILFIIGLKDDLVILSPYTKLVAQLLAIGFIMFNESFRIYSLNGFIGIHEIPFWIFYPAGAFIMLTIINAYNLIDGIDGLAAIVGTIVLMIYTTIFYLANEYFYALICLTLNGSLIAFLGFNFSASKKIFMGDTGSLIVGFIISVLTLKFLALKPESYSELPFFHENAPIIAISILIVPLFDTARVFAIRLVSKKSPFSPDRNHIHHILIDYWDMSHKKASFVIGSFNLLFVALFVVLASISKNIISGGILIISIIILTYIFFKYDYSFGSLKRKIMFRNRIGTIKYNVKDKTSSTSKKKDS